MNRAQSTRTSRVVVNGVLVLTSIYFLFPVWWLIVSATKSNQDLFSSNGLWFAAPHLLDNIQAVLSYDRGMFPRWLLNSIGYSTIAAVLGTLFAAAAGYVLGKFEFRGKSILSISVTAGLLIPAALLTIPLYLLASTVNLTNTVWAIIIPSIVTPFGAYLARVSAEQSVPTEVLEAARLDGASEVRIFRQIVLRILTPALVTIALFTFVGTWNNFMLPLVMLSDASLYPVSLGLYSWQSYLGSATYNLVLTGSLLMVIPLVIGFFVLQRFWRPGMAVGSVKG